MVQALGTTEKKNRSVLVRLVLFMPHRADPSRIKQGVNSGSSCRKIRASPALKELKQEATIVAACLGDDLGQEKTKTT